MLLSNTNEIIEY